MENISLQERLLRLPCYENCLPKVGDNYNDDGAQSIKGYAASSRVPGSIDESYNRSNNVRSSMINLKALQKPKSDNSSSLINTQHKLSFGIFLYKNYR